MLDTAKKGSGMSQDGMNETDNEVISDKLALLTAAIANTKRARDIDPDDFATAFTAENLAL